MWTKSDIYEKKNANFFSKFWKCVFYKYIFKMFQKEFLLKWPLFYCQVKEVSFKDRLATTTDENFSLAK